MEMLQLPDSQLVSMYVKGNESCLEVLINKHQQKIYSYIISRIRDEELANDVFQDVFVKIKIIKLTQLFQSIV